MKFIDQFENIINNQFLQEKVKLMLSQGKKDPLFINYFGVNYNQNNIISIKLYFSFFKLPSRKFLKMFSFSDSDCDMIEELWVPSSKYEYMHQGLTLGLKCYLKDNDLLINNYFHFRSPKIQKSNPKFLNLSHEDYNNNQGVCVEFHGVKRELKQYYYITSEYNKRELLQKLEMPLSDVEKINLIEYTESDLESKVNLIYDKSDDIDEYFNQLNNHHIIALNKYFFEKYNLYFYCPGIRMNSNIKAIYYVSKETFYGLHQEQVIPIIIN